MAFRIFAGNLAFQVSDEDLKEAFSQFGKVTFARVILDRDTGKSRGFGFVEIDGDDAGRKALAALDGQTLKGRALRLREAEPRAERSGGPGPGGGGRGAPPPRDREPRARPDTEQRGGDPDAAQARRRAEPRKPREGESDDRPRRLGIPAGRPQEKVRGGAKNRFRLDDDEEGEGEDIDLFGKFESDEEAEYDIGAVEGVEITTDEDEPQDEEAPK